MGHASKHILMYWKNKVFGVLQARLAVFFAIKQLTVCVFPCVSVAKKVVRPKGVMFDERGFSYVEVLAAVILIGTCLVPMLNGLYSMSTGPAILEERVANRLALQATMDEAIVNIAIVIADIKAGAVSLPTTYPGNVYISYYDVNNIDADNNLLTCDPSQYPCDNSTLLYIQVAIAGQTDHLTTLVSQ